MQCASPAGDSACLAPKWPFALRRTWRSSGAPGAPGSAARGGWVSAGAPAPSGPAGRCVGGGVRGGGTPSDSGACRLSSIRSSDLQFVWMVSRHWRVGRGPGGAAERGGGFAVAAAARVGWLLTFLPPRFLGGSDPAGAPLRVTRPARARPGGRAAPTGGRRPRPPGAAPPGGGGVLNFCLGKFLFGGLFILLPEDRRGRERPASGKGAGIHGVRGASEDVRILGPGFTPDLRPCAPPSFSPRLFSLPGITPTHRLHFIH